MEQTAASRVLTLDSTHHQQWQFSRFSYLEQPRPSHGLLLILGGSMDYVNQEGTLHLEPADLVYLPQGCRYEARIHPGTEDLLINFHILQADPVHFPSQPKKLLCDSLQTLRPLMERTVHSFQEGPEQYFAAMSLFYRFCHELTVAIRRENSGKDLISRAKTLLSQPECPSVEEVARQLLVSPSGLRKAFKDAEGIPPAQYRLIQRVENAKQLLLSTDLPISLIAERCGFCDAAYFHKVFTRFTGLTPTAYRGSIQTLF